MDNLAVPDEVLIAIATQLPPALRLSSFSLAHSRLKAAADNATAQDAFSHTFSMFTAPKVRVTNTDDDRYSYYDDPRDVPDHRQNCCDNFAGIWLPQHGQHLTKLQLNNFNNNFNYGFSTLPPGLKEIELHGCAARWHAKMERGLQHTFGWATCSGGERDMLLDLTSLDKLHMGACSYTHNTIRQVAAATNLQHLTYSYPAPELPSCYIGFFSSHLEHNSLRRLTNLTHLELRTVSPTTGRIQLEVDGGKYGFDNAVQHLSCLVKLQTLIMHNGSVSANLAAGLEGLRNMTGLTRLELAASNRGKNDWRASEQEDMYGHYFADEDGSPARAGGFGDAPWLPALTALQSLHLKHFIVEPSQLHGLTQLTGLHLVDAVFSPTHLLGLLGKLTQLQQLHVSQSEETGLTGAELDREAEQAWPSPSAEYAGLAASSQLQDLSLTNCQLPPGIWQHVFPAGRQLKRLQRLYASCAPSPSDGSGSVMVEAGWRAAPLRLAGSDLACITSACPNLKGLCVW